MSDESSSAALPAALSATALAALVPGLRAQRRTRLARAEGHLSAVRVEAVA